MFLQSLSVLLCSEEILIHFYINSLSYKALPSHCSNSYLVSGSFSSRGRSASPFQSQPGHSFSIHPLFCDAPDTADQLNCRSPGRSLHYPEASHMTCAPKKSASCIVRRESWRGLAVPEFPQSDGHVLPVFLPLSSLHTYSSKYSALFCMVIGI